MFEDGPANNIDIIRVIAGEFCFEDDIEQFRQIHEGEYIVPADLIESYANTLADSGDADWLPEWAYVRTTD